MKDSDLTAGSVVAVLLADGWHPIVRGSFSLAPLALSAGAELGVPGFRFEEIDVGSASRPTVLAGPVNSIIAVRQAAAAAWRTGDSDRSPTARNRQRVDQVARLRVHAGY